MTYIRDLRYPGFWESDGEYTGKYRADDGSLHDSARDADKHDRDRRERAAPKPEGKE
jgi:hypothetical protein